MNRIRNKGAKKLVAIVLVVALSIGSVFASPLNLAGSSNNAKIYNETYKAVSNPEAVTNGWIVRTKDNPVSFENSDLKVTIGENSLVKFISLEDANPVIYLLDGWISAASSESVKLAIKTPVTAYGLTAGSSILVISDAENEHGYIQKGSATAVNAITNAITRITESNYLNLADSSATTKAPEADSKIATIVTKLQSQPVEEPVAEPTVETSVQEETTTEVATEATTEVTTEVATEDATEVITETTTEAATEVTTEATETTSETSVLEAEKAEDSETTVAETITEAEVVLSPLTKTFTYAGYEATITAYVGQAIVEYPAFVTAQEIYAAAAAAYKAYTAYLSEVYIEVVEAGKAVVTYPETYGEAEFNLAVELLEKELPAYISSLFAQDSESKVEETTKVVPVEIEAKSEPAEPIITTVVVPMTKTFTYAGYEATVTADVGQAILEYPAFVTTQELYAAAAAAYSVYSEYLNDVYIEVVEAGKAVVTYPETYGEAEFNFAVELIEKELPAYLEALFAEESEAQINVDVTDVVVEIIAPETSTTKPETEAETEVQTEVQAEEETTVTEVAEAPAVTIEPAKAEKKTNVAFGATIGVVYGQYTEGSEFKAILDKHYIRRIGIAPKSLIINLDPSLTVGNFKLGLHLSLDVLNIKDSFSFNTNNGKTGYINSLAKYIGNINYNSENLNVDIDRTHSIQASSPVFHSMDKAFDKNNSLVATASLDFNFVKVSGFVDDLQLTNHLNGETQYAGINLTAGSKYVTVNASVIAAAKNLKDIDFYPAIDALTSFNLGKTKVTVYAGIAGLYKTKTTATTIKATFDFNALKIGFGLAYNSGSHISSSISNSNVTVVNAFEGNSLDLDFTAGLKLGILSIDGSVTLPLSLNENGGRIAYNTVKTLNGNTKQASADVMSLSAKLDFNTVCISGGVLYEGFAAKLVNVAKAVKRGSGRKAAVKSLVDTDLATVYAQMTLTFGDLEAYVRGDLAAIDGHARVSTTLGASYNF